MKRYLEKESSSSSESLSDPKEATMVIEQENPFRKERTSKKILEKNPQKIKMMLPFKAMKVN